ncbi:hypothetical protein JXA05_03535 [Candidatus Peregrinibacteria bacterium]|nr:hypothetical protein [Candidatus Peregrinibacteria bacterium]
MADDATTTTPKIHVPEDTRAKFGELIDLVLDSHSMDDEERQYWIDVLPIMTDEQIANLRDILNNEKKQIEEAQKAASGTPKKTGPAFDEEAYREKKQARIKTEKEQEEKERAEEEAVLNALQNL